MRAGLGNEFREAFCIRAAVQPNNPLTSETEQPTVDDEIK
jgi:hypothetical protein